MNPTKSSRAHNIEPKRIRTSDFTESPSEKTNVNQAFRQYNMTVRKDRSRPKSPMVN